MSMLCSLLQAGLISASSALAVSPDDPLVKAEYAYLSAADRLWSGMKSNDDPAWTPALEQYAKDMEVSRLWHECVAAGFGGGGVTKPHTRHGRESRPVQHCLR